MRILGRNARLVKSSRLLAEEGNPHSSGPRSGFAGRSPTVVDGPFVETKELIAGFPLCRAQHAR